MKSRRQRLVAKLDKVFSKFIRKRDADFMGYCKCYTCGKQQNIADGQSCRFIAYLSDNATTI